MATLLARETKPDLEEAVNRLRATYAITPGAPLYRQEFGYYCMKEWRQQGLPADASLEEWFHYHPQAFHTFRGAGGCEAAMVPYFDEKVLEDRGRHEVVRDKVGRHVLCFKGRRNGFMPEYLDHPVKDMQTWERDIKWRLKPEAPERFADLEKTREQALLAQRQGLLMRQKIVGGYMYLRSLIGPQELLYFFYDEPELLHDCMRSWLEVSDAVTARHQQFVTLDEIILDEDICYKNGALISPDMIKEFLMPYYRTLVQNARARQIDPTRPLHIHLATDGYVPPIIPIYQEQIGMDVLSPFEVAAGCDVVEIGRNNPQMILSGGIDKRELAKGPKAIDAHLEAIIPPMRERGGYIPTCDHGVPAEVSLKNYLHYRKRCVELGG